MERFRLQCILMAVKIKSLISNLNDSVVTSNTNVPNCMHAKIQKVYNNFQFSYYGRLIYTKRRSFIISQNY